MKFNKWALAAANTVAVFYTAAAAALYFWGEQALTYVEKMHMIKLSEDMLSLDITPTSFAYGLVTRYVVTYVFVALVIRMHDRLKK